MKPVRITIFFQLFIFTALLVAGISIGLGFWFAFNAKKLVLSEMRLRSEMLSKTLAENAVKGVETRNIFRSLNPLIQSTLKQRDVIYIHILDATGIVLASSKLKEGQAWVEENRDEDLEIESPIVSPEKESITGQKEVLLGIPSGTTIQIGSVRLGVSLKHVKQNIQVMTLISLLISGMFLMSGVGVAFVFARLFSNRIRSLKEATEQIEHGVIETHVFPKREDELGDLTHTFNRMARALTLSMQEVSQTRARLEERVLERTAELARINADLEQFSIVASHDLKEPLRGVAIYAQLLKERYENRLDQDANNIIAAITGNIHRMNQMLEALLEYTRVRQGKIHSMNSAIAVRHAVANLHTMIQESHGVIRCDYDTMPTVMMDETMMTILFQNLISNALRFHGPEPPRIEITGEEMPVFPSDGHATAPWVEAGGALFSVCDNGIGINPAHFEKIFLPFQRLHAQTKYPGTGIGLPICKKIVDRLGGRIWVESEEEKGATFFFTIPNRREETTSESI